METKRYLIKMYVYPRRHRNGKAFGFNLKSGYWEERYYNGTLAQATEWISQIHNLGLVWVSNWNIIEQ